MSSSVHLRQQSCFKPLLTEPQPSRMEPESQRSQYSDSIDDNCRGLDVEINSFSEEEEQKRKVVSSGKDCDAKTQEKDEVGGWSFLQSLSSFSRIIKTENEEEKIYVHPLTKTCSSSSSILSLKSLEMCTESLGSETGCQESESSSKEENRLVWSIDTQKNPRNQSLKLKRVKTEQIFHRHLTSTGGNDGVRMKSHRENGRLVLKAEFVNCCRSYFQAERGNGRLRLRVMKNSSAYGEIEGDQEVEEDIEGNTEIVGK